MMGKRSRHKHSLSKKYRPSEPCPCEICVGYCMRPGWWSVAEAARAMEAGYGPRMMLEMSPELTFGVLSPAFKGCEGDLAINLFSQNGCTFLRDTHCELTEQGISLWSAGFAIMSVRALDCNAMRILRATGILQ
jgi:hypothetical protein